jgi:hypothetical protein
MFKKNHHVFDHKKSFTIWKLENERETFIWGPPNNATINNISNFYFFYYQKHGFKE